MGVFLLVLKVVSVVKAFRRFGTVCVFCRCVLYTTRTTKIKI